MAGKRSKIFPLRRLILEVVVRMDEGLGCGRPDDQDVAELLAYLAHYQDHKEGNPQAMYVERVSLMVPGMIFREPPLPDDQEPNL